MMSNENNDRLLFESAIRALEAEMANVGAHVTIDSASRLTYARQIKAMSDQMRMEVVSGRMTWMQAAQQAQETRNLIMEIIRGKSTPVGRVIAEDMKRNGRTLNALIAEKTRILFGEKAEFTQLSNTQKIQYMLR